MLRPRISRILLAALLSGILPFIASGQDARGRISGTVVDPEGAVVPHTEVVALNAATGVRVTSKTNESGQYDIPFLNPGIYTLSVSSPGFRSYERTNLEVRIAERLLIDVALEVGAVSESITVSGQASLLETSTASVGRVVDGRRILDLPLPGGNALSLARLAPGVVNLAAPSHPSLGPATEVMSNLSVNGVRSGNIEFTVDGTPAMWGTNTSYAPPTEMVAEFKVQTATYDASAGRSPGGNVNVVLRSGANQFHSTLYFFHNNQHLQSMDLFQRQTYYNPATGPAGSEKLKTVMPVNILNRYGAVFSGPAGIPKVYDGKNKTFWVYSFEGLTRPGIERGNYFYTVPAPAERRGDFSQLLSVGANYQIFDPATTTPAPNGRFQRQPFARNIVPQSRLDKTALGLLPYWPDANLPGTVDGRNNYTRPPRSWNEFRTHTVKADHNFNEKHRLFGRYNQWFQLFTSGQVFDNIATGQDRWRRNYGAVVDDVYIFSPALLNNVRLGFTRTEQSFDPLGLGFDLAGAGFSPALAAAINPMVRSFPNLDVNGYRALGNANNSRSFANYFTLSNDVNWTRGKHVVKAGVEFRLYREHNYGLAAMNPALTFAGTYTRGPLDNSPASPKGQGLATFLLGIPTGGQINVNDSSAEQSQTWGFYFQDDWRITGKFTLNAGLRYDLDVPITERYNRSVSGFDYTSPNPESQRAIANYAKNPLPELPVSQFKVNGGLLFAGVNGRSRNFWRADRNNFSPRVGFSWNVFKNTVLRGGYGLFYVPLGADRQSVNQTGFTLRTSLVPSTDNGQTYIASLSNPFPGGWTNPPGASLGLATDVGRAISFFPARYVNGYMQRYSFGIQQQLPKDFVFDISYLANRGSSLSVTRQLNPVPNSYLSTLPTRDEQTINYLSAQVANPFYPLPGTNLSGVNAARSQLLRPYPQFTGITVAEPGGASWYHSMQVVAERRFRQGFTVQFNYTLSKNIEAIDFLNEGDAVPERVISDLDRTHRWAISGIYELPFGKGKPLLTNANRLLDGLAGGWQLQAVWQANTGQPLGFGNALMLARIDQAVLSGNQQTLGRWFNIDAFNRSAPQQLASNLQVLSSRFSRIRAPGVDTWDISAVKNIAIGEKLKAQFRCEFQNALNRSNLQAPNTAPINSLFGQIDGVNGMPRYIHFGLKLIY